MIMLIFHLCRIPDSDWTFLSKYFSNAENTYVKENRALKFIPDLLKIHVPGLIDSTPEEGGYPSNLPARLFKTSIRFFINIHALKEGVMDDIPAMLVHHINATYASLMLICMHKLTFLFTRCSR